MHSGWDFLHRQPGIWIRIVCLFEGPVCGQLNRRALESRHICPGYVSHGATHLLAKQTCVGQLWERAKDVLTCRFLRKGGPNKSN